MNRYLISYITNNHYSQPVNKAVLEFMVLPEENTCQKYSNLVIHNSHGISPQFSESLYKAQLMRFNIFKRFTDFNLEVSFIAEKEEFNPFDFVEPAVAYENEMMNDLAFIISNQNFLALSSYTTPEDQDIPCSAMRHANEPVFAYLLRLNNFVGDYLKYQPDTTTTRTKIDEILRYRKGVCQDFAHLFICIARINGIPARYTSGYLNQGNDFNGNAALHAWAEALVPGIGWIGFDPANKLVANGQYIEIGHGIDYSDCMPIKGVLQFSGESITRYQVNVKLQNSLNYIQNQVQSQ